MTKTEHLRLVTFRSRFLEHAKRIGNVAATCRFFGISRPKFYKWKKRFDELGAAGLADRPRTPKHSLTTTNVHARSAGASLLRGWRSPRRMLSRRHFGLHALVLLPVMPLQD